MKLLLGISVFVLCGAALCAPQQPYSSEIASTKKNFHLNGDEKMTWKDALDYCKSKGWTLASITSQAESDEVKRLIRQNGNGANFWIGLTKLATGKWIWFPHHEQLTFTDWQNGQPDSATDADGAEDCVHLWNTQGYRWNDTKCNYQFYVVCEEQMF